MTPKPQPNPIFIVLSNMLIGMGLGFVFTAMTMHPGARTMPKLSAGLVLYRVRESSVEVLLVHPGGPFWKNKDAGAWSIPKGEHDTVDEGLEVALREFQEETGHPAPAKEWSYLGDVRQRSGKVVHAWTAEGDIDTAQIHSNVFSMEWPRGSGNVQEFPEVDRAAWFDLPTARGKILPAQATFIERLSKRIGQVDGPL